MLAVFYGKEKVNDHFQSFVPTEINRKE